jgi:tetratricopeptide (TPR) repeat protein/tRNA A-37 threonylcarbamoyl transferase component Bud32
VRDSFPENRWAKVETLFLEATDLPLGERESFVDERCGGDTHLREEVLSLLRYDTGEESPLLEALQASAASAVHDDLAAGRMVGPYRIEREIGRGGMAVVYLAVRADGEFRKRVAIKLIKRGMDTMAVVERLRRERRILAALEHPAIARLLDGGTTPDGRPWIAMEYVEGIPVNRYCEENRLGVEERCRLMTGICQGVAYAHRKLVIHRDLKPTNILVDAGGNPKLLDFGIAKLLAAEEEDETEAPLTRGTARPLTPEYASPEQLDGGAIGTTTDVYSLGVVLYELLAGSRPPDRDLKVSAAAARAGKDRRWQRGLEGDLDNILQVAMRAEPERRYLSMERFEKDLRLHLAGMPVEAREETLLYRTGKFVRRHRAGVAAAALIFLSLVAGMASTLWEAHRTEEQRQLAEKRRVEAERESARLAVAEKRAEGEHASAERRFAEVREMAGKFMFDFHDAIATLPGSTPARKMVVETGIRYYDSLLKDAGGDQALLEEIARGYDRLGDVQGNPYYPNLGDVPAAGQSYQKALAVRGQITDASAAFLRDQVKAGVRRAQLLIVRGDIKGSEQPLLEAIAMGSRGPQAGTYEVREAVAYAWSAYGDVKMRVGNFIECIPPYSKVLDIWTALAREKRDPASERAGISLAHTKIADTWSRMGRSQDALDHISIAVKIDKQLSADDPNNVTRLRKLYIDYLVMGLMFRSAGPAKLDGQYDALSAAQSAVEIADRLAAADPDNSSRLVDIVNAQTMLGDLLRKQGDVNGALVHDRRALDAAERRVAATGGGLDNEESLVQTRERLGSALAEAGQFNDATENFAKATASLASLEKENPGLPRLQERRGELMEAKAEAYARAKDWQPAIEAFNEAIAVVEGRRKQSPEDILLRKELAEYSSKLADGYAALGQWSNAARGMQSSLDALKEIESRRPLLPEEEKMRRDGLTAIETWKQK